MRAGPRNTQVTFQRPVSSSNGDGTDSVTYTTLGTAWVNIAALPGQEKESHHQLWAEARFRIVASHPGDDYTLQRADQIVWGSRTLDILDVEDPDQKRRQLVILAKEYTA